MKTKKLLAAVMILILFAGLLPVSAFADSDLTAAVNADAAAEDETKDTDSPSQEAAVKALTESKNAPVSNQKAESTATINYSTDDSASEKGPQWQDSETISKSAGFDITSPPDEDVVKAKPGYTFAYVRVSYRGRTETLPPGTSRHYPISGDYFWNDVTTISVGFYWSAIQHNVTYVYDLPDGYPSDFDPASLPEAAQVTEYVTVSLAEKPTTAQTANGTREGSWEFTWTVKDANGADVETSSDTFVMPKADVIVTGSWRFTPVKHKVTFVLDGGTMSSSSEIGVDDDDTVSRPDDDPVKDDGTYFSGWYADDGFTTEFDFDNTPIKKDTQIYARYLRHYTIKFDLNGGSLTFGSPLDLEMEEGEKVKIPIWNDPDPDGEPIQDFLVPPADSEYTGAEIDGIFYAPGAYYEITGDATVLVCYRSTIPPTRSISYDLNGGTLDGKTGTVTIKAENGTTITLPAPTREGYTFDYWEGSRYNAGDSYTVNGDHTFTAQWTKNSAAPAADAITNTPAPAADAPTNTPTPAAITPAKTASPAASASGKTSPKTGDESDPALWSSLVILSLIMMFALQLYSRRRKTGK